MKIAFRTLVDGISKSSNIIQDYVDLLYKVPNLNDLSDLENVDFVQIDDNMKLAKQHGMDWNDEVIFSS